MEENKRKKHREYMRKYRLTEKYKKYHGSVTKSWSKANPEKRKAHSKINNMLRDGKLIKPDNCDDCGEKTKLFGHHEDYSIPEVVMWLCDICHKQRHGRIADKTLLKATKQTKSNN